MAQSPISNSYGTVNNTVVGNDGGTAIDEEEQPLLGRKSEVKSWWRGKMAVDVRRDWTDIVLLACYVITGILDSASISTWGAFVSMQTGNTVYVGLGPTAGTNRWKKSSISILSFCIGSFFFSRLHRVVSPSPKRRWVLCLSFIIQMLFIIAAASIVTWGPQGSGPDDVPWYVLIPIALVAFQSCGQAVASRAMKYNALTSVVLTSIYCDLFSDAALFESISVNVERNQRVAAPSLLLVGALLGGFIAKSALGTAGALWIAAALKFVIVLSWGFWPADN
ncbi:Fc.00g115780.m01.CDS01 [Cosmosporella sp. VM-42]